MQATSRYFDKGRHCPVDPITEAENRRSLTDNSVPFLKALHPTSGFHHKARKLVPEHNWVVYRPTVGTSVLVKVAPANPHRLDGHQHIVIVNLR